MKRLPAENEMDSPAGQETPWRWWLLGIAVLGAALRLHDLGRYALWYDEAGTMYYTQYLSDPLKLFDHNYGSGAPLFLFLTSVWYKVVLLLPGVERGSVSCDYLLRLLPCVFGILGIPATFIFGRVITRNNQAALVAAFLYAISPFQVYYAQELRNYTLHILLCFAATAFMARALEESRPRDWTAFTLIAAASIYNHFVAIWTLLVLNLYFVITLKPHWKRLRPWVFSNLAIGVLSFPVLLKAFAVNQFFRSSTGTWYPSPDLRLALITFKDFFMGYSESVAAYRLMTILCAALLVLGTVAMRKRPKAAILLLCLAFVPLAMNILQWRGNDHPFWTHRLFIFSALPCYLLVGRGVTALGNRRLATLATLLLGALTVPALADHYAQRLHPQWAHILGAQYKPDHREAAHYVEKGLLPGDIIAHDGHTRAPFTYYIDAEQYRVAFTEQGILDATDNYPNLELFEKSGFMPRLMDDLVGRADRIWLVQSSWSPVGVDVNAEALVPWLDARGFRLDRRAFDGLNTYLYALDPELRSHAELFQLADSGESQVPYYHFPPESRTSEIALACEEGLWDSLEDTSYRPSFFGLRFALAVADEEGIVLDAQPYNTDFRANALDGRTDSLILPQLGVELDRGDTFSRSESADLSLLALDGTNRKALLAPFPLECEDEFTYAFTIDNTTDETLELRVQTYESVDTIHPLALLNSDRSSSAWHPSLQHTARSTQEKFNTFEMLAAMGRDTPDGAGLHKDLRLDPGTYRLFARCGIGAGPDNHWGAYAHFNVGSETGEAMRLMGIVRAVSSGPESGWRWIEVGSFESDGASVRLSVSIHNTDRLDGAYFHLGRIMIVRDQGAATATPLNPQRHTLKVDPRSSKTFQITSALGAARSKRVEIEAFHRESRQFRSLSFRVTKQ